MAVPPARPDSQEEGGGFFEAFAPLLAGIITGATGGGFAGGAVAAGKTSEKIEERRQIKRAERLQESELERQHQREEDADVRAIQEQERQQRRDALDEIRNRAALAADDPDALDTLADEAETNKFKEEATALRGRARQARKAQGETKLQGILDDLNEAESPEEAEAIRASLEDSDLSADQVGSVTARVDARVAALKREQQEERQARSIVNLDRATGVAESLIELGDFAGASDTLKKVGVNITPEVLQATRTKEEARKSIVRLTADLIKDEDFAYGKDETERQALAQDVATQAVLGAYNFNLSKPPPDATEDIAEKDPVRLARIAEGNRMSIVNAAVRNVLEDPTSYADQEAQILAGIGTDLIPTQREAAAILSQLRAAAGPGMVSGGVNVPTTSPGDSDADFERQVRTIFNSAR